MLFRSIGKSIFGGHATPAEKTSAPAAELSMEAGTKAVLSNPAMYNMLRWQQFLRQCFVPAVFYDIGAHDPFSFEGQQTIFKPLMPDTKFFLFEAMAKHEDALKRSGEPYALALLSSEDHGERMFYQSARHQPGHGDSYYRERTTFYDDASLIAERHTTRRLDSVVEERGWPLPDFMKLDTQGSELDILRGAPRCLAHARGLQIECNVTQYNEGAPLIDEVIGFTRSAGFRLRDVVQLHFLPNNELLQLDAIFVRDTRTK